MHRRDGGVQLGIREGRSMDHGCRPGAWGDAEARLTEAADEPLVAAPPTIGPATEPKNVIVRATGSMTTSTTRASRSASFGPA